MPPAWLPLTALLAIIFISALRVFSVESKHGVKAFSFGRHAPIQSVAERNWKLATGLALAAAAVAWLAPDWETALGRPAWADTAALKWISVLMFAGSVVIVAAAQIQMGASWRIGVPAEGPGPLVAHGLFAWSRKSHIRRHDRRGARHVPMVAASADRLCARRNLDACARAGAH